MSDCQLVPRRMELHLVDPVPVSHQAAGTRREVSGRADRHAAESMARSSQSLPGDLIREAASRPHLPR
jgi:hypothetical protein